MPFYNSLKPRSSTRTQKPGAIQQQSSNTGFLRRRELPPSSGNAPSMTFPASPTSRTATAAETDDNNAMDVDVQKLVADVIKQTEASKRTVTPVPFPAQGRGDADADQYRTRKRSRTTALLSSLPIATGSHKRSRSIPSELTSGADTPFSSPSSYSSSSSVSSIPIATHHAKRQRTATPEPLSDASSAINALPQPAQRQQREAPVKPQDKPSRLTTLSSAPSSSPLPSPRSPPRSPPPAPAPAVAVAPQAFPSTPASPPSPPRPTQIPVPATPRQRVDHIRTTVTPPRPGSSLLRRKRPTAGEIQSLIFLYRSLIYGLKALHTRPASTFNIYALPEPSTASEDPTKRGHLYDNWLARRVRAYLLYLGVDRNILEVDVEGIRAEVLEYGFQHQQVDGTGTEDFPDVETLLQDARFAHPQLYCFTNCSVLSYPQLVAMLTMRHRAKANARPKQTTGRKRSRIPSSLRTVHHVGTNDTSDVEC